MRKIKAFLLSLLLMSMSSLTCADEIKTIIDEASQAYSQQQFALSVERLQQAMNLIKQVQADDLRNFFPKPLAGWVISAPGNNQQSFSLANLPFGSLNAIVQKYEIQAKPTVKTVNKTASGQGSAAATPASAKSHAWVQFTLIQNPNEMIKLAYQGMQALRVIQASETLMLGKYQGNLLCGQQGANCDLFFNFADKYMLMINAEHTDKAILKQYVQGFDIDGLMKRP